jgi:hypothetical protein
MPRFEAEFRYLSLSLSLFLSLSLQVAPGDTLLSIAATMKTTGSRHTGGHNTYNYAQEQIKKKMLISNSHQTYR